MADQLNQSSPLQLTSPLQTTIAQPTSPGFFLISSTSTVQSKAVLSENSEHSLDNIDAYSPTPVFDNE